MLRTDICISIWKLSPFNAARNGCLRNAIPFSGLHKNYTNSVKQKTGLFKIDLRFYTYAVRLG
jgi:hypothetical protein